MLIKSVPGDEIIPHRDSMFATHNSNPVLAALDQLDPMYAGGYPLALFAAPRWGTDPTRIRSGYFTDVDIYPKTFRHMEEIRKFIEGNLGGNFNAGGAFKTPNAYSYLVEGPNQTTKLQVMCTRFGTPKEVISSFDFVNCSIAIKPQGQEVYFHKDLIKFHRKKELQILYPWMLNNYGDRSQQHLVLVELLRFKKYCDRWDYTLSKDSLTKLLEIYESEPNLSIEKGKKYLLGSGARAVLANAGSNIWHVLAEHIKQSPYWDPSMDTHGIITNPLDKNTEVPLLSEWITSTPRRSAQRRPNARFNRGRHRWADL